MKKRLLPLLLALVLTAGVLPIAVSAAAGSMTIRAINVTATTSDREVKVPIRVDSNSGFGSGIVPVEWDKDKLTLTDVTFSASAPNNGSAPVSNSGRYKIAFGSDLASADFTGTGDLFTLSFRIPAGAAAGEIPITIAAADVQDSQIKNVSVTTWNGKVTLTAPPVSVSGALSGGTLTYAVTSAPAGARLIAARYDGSRMTAMKMVTGTLTNGSVTLGGTGNTYRLFLVDTACRPLCKAWSSG